MILTLLTIPYPNIDPVFLEIPVPFLNTSIQLRWYGLMYMVGFILGFFALRGLSKRRKLNLSTDDLYDLLFYLILGVMVGGRLGYVLFYDLDNYLQNPASIFAIWQGGMSFHGGLIGTILAAWYISRKKKWDFWEIADLCSAAFPIGIGLVRIGNFINGELWGRRTDVAWAMVFPDGGPMPRHPSQLYEALLEGLVLLIILLWMYRKNFYRGTVFWAFLGFYGLFRFLGEFVREPDIQIGYQFGFFTRGQLLTLPMLAIGMIFMVRNIRRTGSEPVRSKKKTRAH